MHLAHQQAPCERPQPKQFPTPNHAPQPTIHTHSLDAAYPIFQPNLLQFTQAQLTILQTKTTSPKHRATDKHNTQHAQPDAVEAPDNLCADIDPPGKTCAAIIGRTPHWPPT